MFLIVASIISFTLIVLSFDYLEKGFFKVSKGFFITGSLILIFVSFVIWKGIRHECKYHIPPKSYENLDLFCQSFFWLEAINAILLTAILVSLYYFWKENYMIVKVFIGIVLFLVILFTLIS